MGVENRLLQSREIELPGSLEGPQGVQSRDGTGARAGQLPQGSDGRRVVLFHQQPLRGIAPPAIRVRERFHQFLGTGLRQMRPRARWFGFADDTVDTAQGGLMVQATVEYLLAQVT